MALNPYIDPLLGIYNYIGFKEELRRLIKEKEFSEILLYLIDFRDFKRLNLLFGIEKVNLFLKNLFTDLQNLISYQCTWGRLGPDLIAFFFLLPPKKVLFNTAVEIAEKILEFFKKPIKYNSKTVKLDLNIAIVIYPYDAITPEELLEKAEKTLIKCKEIPNTYLLYTQFLEEDLEKEAQALELIAYAVENQKFIFHFQPYFYTLTLDLAGFETLVRIIDKNGNIISPGTFIETLEKGPYLKSFEEWCLNEIKKVIETMKKSLKNFSIALNIAPTSFLDQDFLKNLLELLHQGYGKNLIIEITERTFIDEPQRLLTSFRLVKMADPFVKIAIDDFGTGVTSLKYLLDYPVDIIKIDAFYIKRMLEDSKSLIIVETLLELAKKLELKVIAEGVERKEQFDRLKELGCDIVQGFFLARPLPLEKVLKSYTS